MLTWRKKLSIMNKFLLSGHIPLLDYEIWIAFQFLRRHHNTSNRILCHNAHASVVFTRAEYF
jgi:hypothetical protein